MHVKTNHNTIGFLRKKSIELNQTLNSITIQSNHDRESLTNIEHDLKVVLKHISQVLDS